LGFAPRGGASARKEWYDRNPVRRKNRFFAMNVPPHSGIQRWTYTVPTNKKACIEFLTQLVMRYSVATTVGLVELYIMYQPFGESAATMLSNQLLTNNVGDKDEHDFGMAGLLQEGDLVYARSYDISTGGAVSYVSVLHVTEFDA